jgi:PIN domain nuclease of toxin-antitoxin system
VKLLLDTHALLWFLQNSSELSDIARNAVINPKNEVSVSIASYWEIAIKQSVSKDAGGPISVVALERLAVEQRIFTKALTTDTMEQTNALSMSHQDPFDRVIAATAIAGGLSLVSGDIRFDRFLQDRLW